MVILGLVAGLSGAGKPLKDGSAALLMGGRLVCAVAEERLLREKRAGGWERSAGYCLEAAGIAARDVQAVAYSTCCDSLDEPARDLDLMAARFPRARIVRAPHHLSHAIYAFHGSPFERALVAVADAGGNASAPADRWWSVPREQATYFAVDDAGWRLLDEDFGGAYEAGAGETFRAVTYYLGWSGSRHTNKTMALSAYGDAGALELPPFFSLPAEARGIRGAVHNDPPAPVAMIGCAFDGAVGRRVAPRRPGEPHADAHKHLAALLQSSYEDTAGRRISDLCRRHGLPDVCLSGGVAYNCLANAHVAAQDAVRAVYVPPAPGDTGQSIGNALWAHRRLSHAPVDRDAIADPYTGRTYDSHDAGRPSLPAGLVARPCPAPSERVVGSLVVHGLVVGHLRGGSEIGARALGHRSIFADPRRPDLADTLNRRKGREAIMPFGGSILASAMGRLFHGVPRTPYMQFVLRAGPEARRRLPAIVHVDGSSRLQSVDDEGSPPWMRSLLREVEHATGVAAVLNTSLNGPGEPIVERPDEAVRLVREGVVDCLVVEDTIVAPEPAMSGLLALSAPAGR
jgi:carbamoyltransferase